MANVLVCTVDRYGIREKVSEHRRTCASPYQLLHDFRQAGLHLITLATTTHP